MALTLISHFYNEQFLLPYWLRHHVGLFDHGILLDYASTDRSRAIIHELAPSWEVRSSVNAHFDAEEVDAEVMAVERECSGWKMVLNTTEFLLAPDLSTFLASVEQEQPERGGIWPFDLTMVDRLAEANAAVTDAPLWEQKGWGYHSQGARSRLLHRYPDGRYDAGRHSTSLVPKALDEHLFILWFGWCPMRYVRPRKLQIGPRLSERDRAEGRGRHHLMSAEEMEAAFLHETVGAYELAPAHPAYQRVLKALSRSAGLVLVETDR
jgi:hypothetical protein